MVDRRVMDEREGMGDSEINSMLRSARIKTDAVTIDPMEMRVRTDLGLPTDS